MDRLIFTFGKTCYEVENPPAAWTQSDRRFEDDSPMDPIECRTCGASVTFVFPARDLELARHASNYMNPVSIRCDCFLENPGPTSAGYQTKLKMEPIKIRPLTNEIP
jgi:hypothetical protein